MLQAYQQRVMDEQAELVWRIDKLREFMQTSTFFDLDSKEIDRMYRQLKHMTDYSRVLGERIDAF